MFSSSTSCALAQALRGLRGAPPRDFQGTACPPRGPRCPRHPRGSTLTFPPGHVEPATGSLGMAVRHVINPTGLRRSIFEKGHGTLLPQGIRSPKGPVGRTLEGNFFFFPKTRFL
jgi:hypothetical protein